MEVIQHSRVVQRHAERIEEQVCVWMDRSRTRLMQRAAGGPKERHEQSRHACSSALVELSLPDHGRRLLDQLPGEGTTPTDGTYATETHVLQLGKVVPRICLACLYGFMRAIIGEPCGQCPLTPRQRELGRRKCRHRLFEKDLQILPRLFTSCHSSPRVGSNSQLRRQLRHAQRSTAVAGILVEHLIPKIESKASTLA